ncbi:MAG TPA: hypothetical protein VGZ00_13285 [Candidatus Baltobacteraceae bacterium]|nr:hypothetical protein [Candidatus Baltobacteraceae bacterium]
MREPHPFHRIASGGNADAYFSETPSWRVDKMRVIDPFGWHIVTRTEMLLIIEKLKFYEEKTWRQILVDERYHNHPIPRNELGRAAQECLDEVWQGGVDEVFSLRLNNKSRIFGIMNMGAFHLLWWDRDHSVCPSTFMQRYS